MGVTALLNRMPKVLTYVSWKQKWRLMNWGTKAWVGNLKQWVPITSKSSKFKGETQQYVVTLPKSAGARHYCPKILQGVVQKLRGQDEVGRWSKKGKIMST